MQALKRLRLSFPAFDTLLQRIDATTVQSATSSHTSMVTHSGSFHCDEALACALLKVLPAFYDFDICRSRNPSLIESGHIVVDVGAVFDVERRRFDHHQNSFTETFSDTERIKLSSAGLVYKYYGAEILAQLFPQLDPHTVELLFTKMYSSFIKEIDGIDNGVEIAPIKERAYHISTNLSSRVANLQASKAENANNPAAGTTEEEQNSRFREAMELTITEFCSQLHYLVNEWVPARKVVEAVIRQAPEVHPSGAIIRLNDHVPWKAHLVDIEKELKLEGKIKFCLFPGEGTSWRVQTVPITSNSGEKGDFSMRVRLKWAGLRDAELSQASGIPSGIFVHASGFIGGNHTYEGALAMAVASMEEGI